MPVRVEGAPVKILALARNGKALLAVASYGAEGEVRLMLDNRLLGLPKDTAATNAETGEPVDRTAPGQYRLTVPRHDFRLLLIRPRKQPDPSGAIPKTDRG